MPPISPAAPHLVNIARDFWEESLLLVNEKFRTFTDTETLGPQGT